MGFTVSAHEDAETALVTLSTHDDIVLLATDMSLPGMNGVQLAHTIRARMPVVPILLMSGHDQDEIDAAGGVPNPGMTLQKPIGLADLRAAVDTLLS